MILLAARSQNHASQSSAANSMNLSGSPDPELCAGKGQTPINDTSFVSPLISPGNGRVRARRCGEVANVTNSAYLDDVLANFDLIAAESLIGLHHSEVARFDLRAASAVLKTVGSASDATDDMRKEAVGLQRGTAKDPTERTVSIKAIPR